MYDYRIVILGGYPDFNSSVWRVSLVDKQAIEKRLNEIHDIVTRDRINILWEIKDNIKDGKLEQALKHVAFLIKNLQLDIKGVS